MGDFDYCEGFVERKFRDSFPNPIEYQTAAGNWADVIPYAHTKYPDASFAPGDAWKWRLHFNLQPGFSTSGMARLTIAFASTDHAQCWIYVNNDNSLFSSFYPDNGDGNAFIRQSNFAKYSYKTIDIPMSRLQAGDNVITLVMPSNSLWVSHHMYDYLSLEATADAVLPVSLTEFTANKQGGSALLQWRTATEQNSSHFLVERSADGRDFTAIGELKAHGNSLQSHQYQLVDAAPLSGQNYYRLQMVDMDGKAVYSPVRQLYFADAMQVQLYPNPAGNYLQISIDAGKNISQVLLYDMLGKARVLPIQKLGNTATLQTSTLAAGTYSVMISYEGGTVLEKFIKQ